VSAAQRYAKEFKNQAGAKIEELPMARPLSPDAESAYFLSQLIHDSSPSRTFASFAFQAFI
jgi:hypothetical protein